ncbi:unnamed protein product, partial [Staurois parvus]
MMTLVSRISTDSDTVEIDQAGTVGCQMHRSTRARQVVRTRDMSSV